MKVQKLKSYTLVICYHWLMGSEKGGRLSWTGHVAFTGGQRFPLEHWSRWHGHSFPGQIGWRAWIVSDMGWVDTLELMVQKTPACKGNKSSSSWTPKFYIEQADFWWNCICRSSCKTYRPVFSPGMWEVGSAHTDPHWKEIWWYLDVPRFDLYRLVLLVKKADIRGYCQALCSVWPWLPSKCGVCVLVWFLLPIHTCRLPAMTRHSCVPSGKTQRFHWCWDVVHAEQPAYTMNTYSDQSL